jgi:Na+/melibiose symporter-like transporter
MSLTYLVVIIYLPLIVAIINKIKKYTTIVIAILCSFSAVGLVKATLHYYNMLNMNLQNINYSEYILIVLYAIIIWIISLIISINMNLKN